MISIEEMIALVNFRVAAVGLLPVSDGYGNCAYQKKSIFEREDVLNALKLSLTAFNGIPPFTNITMDDDMVIPGILDILVTYASYVLLQRQALTEKGREYMRISYSMNGISYTPPDSIGDFLFEVSKDLYEKWYNQVSILKKSNEFIETLAKEYS